MNNSRVNTLTRTVLALLCLCHSAFGQAKENYWDISGLPENNFFRTYIKGDPHAEFARLITIYKLKKDSAERKTATDALLSNPQSVETLSQMVDAMAASYALFLEFRYEAKYPLTNQQFVFAKTHPDIRLKLRVDAAAMIKHMGGAFMDSNTMLHGLGACLSSLNDKRAIPIVSRGIFYTAPIYMMGDSFFGTPDSSMATQLWDLMFTLMRDELNGLPKPTYLQNSLSYEDIMRLHVLENRERFLPNGIPELANIKEDTFRQYVKTIQGAPPPTEDEADSHEGTSRIIWFAVGVIVLAVAIAAFAFRGRKQWPT